METKERLQYIDTAKAIGIILVIAGHCPHAWSMLLHNTIYSFHIPLFFIISGMFIKSSTIGNSLKKYSKAYLWPYLITGILQIILLFFIDNVKNENIVSFFKNQIIKLIWGSGSDRGEEHFSTMPVIGALWFLIALFMACVIYSCIKHYCNKFSKYVLVVLFYCISIISIRFIRLPFSTQAALCAMLFMCIGETLREYHVMDKINILPKIIILGFVIVWISNILYYPVLEISIANGGFNPSLTLQKKYRNFSYIISI